MLKNKTKIILIFLITILLFSTTFVLANNETNDEGIMLISEDSEIAPITEDTASNTQNTEEAYKKSDVYLIGDEITIDYIIDGNLFVCANTVIINSQIGGDAFILADNLIVNEDGYIFSNLFSIAKSIEIKGIVYDVYALADNLTLSKGYIYRDLKTTVGTLNINGFVGRNAFVNCSTINFNTDENSNGIIYGNLTYSASAKMAIPENAVNGTINYSVSEEDSETTIQTVVANYILDLGKFLSFVLIVWLLCLWLAPKFLSTTNDYIGKKIFSIFGYGAIALVLIPIICIVLILLQLTGGFSLFLLGVYALAIIVTKSLFTIVINNYVCSKLKINKNSGIFGMLIVSGIVVWALTQIPFIGGLISFIVTVFGLGILIISILPKKNVKTLDVNV